MTFTRVQGCDLHWVELGEGPPLVLLHGLCDSHRTWSKVAPLLAQKRRVLMPDLAGHGLSERPDVSYAIGLFWGEADRVIPIAHATESAALLGGASLTRFGKCGHFPHRQEPAAFARALETFLDAPIAPTGHIEAAA